MTGEPRWGDLAISRLLRGGVILSISVVLVGVALTFIHHPSYARSRPDLVVLTNPDQPYPSSVRTVAAGAEQRRGQSVVMIGLLLLIATPVARVALSIVVFAIERDRLYVVITTVVLALLLTSFFLGAVA
jgi:uncharacterized membrane protein